MLFCFYFLNANRHEISFSFSTVWVRGHLKKKRGVSPVLHPLIREFPSLYPVCDPGDHIKHWQVAFPSPLPPEKFPL